MISKSAIRWLARPHLFRPLHFPFSNSLKLKEILEKVPVSNDGKKTSLLDSGLVVGQHIDEATKKVSISLNLNTDYRRVKALLKSELEAVGFK
jgi:hypothetical protein